MDGHIEVGPPPNKKLLKWVNKEQNNFNVYNVAFKEKAPGDRIILNLCTKNLNDLIYSSWDTEHDRLKLVILGHFLHFYSPKNQENQNFEKMKKLLHIIILAMWTTNHSYMIFGSWDTEWDRQDFLSFWAIFCLFTFLMLPKNKILKNEKNSWRYQYFIHLYLK